MIRKIVLSLLFGVIIGTSLSATELDGEFVPQKHYRSWMYKSTFSLNFGTLQYVGELSNEMWRLKKLHGSFGFKYERKLNRTFDVRFQYTHGIIDYYQFETEMDSLNYAFRTSLHSLEFGVKYRLNNGVFMDEMSTLSPYVYIGLSDIISRADHYVSGGSIDFGIPFGWGVDYDVTPGIRIGFSSTFHYTFSDNLDGWDRTRDGDPKNLMDRLLYTGISIGFRFM